MQNLLSFFSPCVFSEERYYFFSQMPSSLLQTPAASLPITQYLFRYIKLS